MKRGLFITFEGTEGCGKTTQLVLLAERLGRKVIMIREPGGTLVGEDIRRVFKGGHEMSAMTELFLLSASRAQLVQDKIVPALEAGITVLCDRYYDSTLAYQGYGRGLDRTMIQEINEYAIQGVHPDLTLLLRVPLRLSEVRQKVRGPQDRIEKSGSSFFQRVEEGFEDILLGNPDRVKVLDGTKPVDVLGEEIWTLVSAALTKKR